MDNLAIISQRIVENSKVNPRKYGLVKQIGPYDITPADMFNYHENPRKIRRLQAIQPDAVPNGVQDDLVYLPTLLGGGFSMEKGSVVQEAIYDARITAPGQKVRGMPLEGPGVLRAINSQVIAPNTYPVPSAMVSSAPLETTPQGYPEPMRTESDQVIVPNAPKAPGPATPQTTPSTTPSTDRPASKNEYDKAWWDGLSGDERIAYIRKFAGEFPGRFKDVIQYFNAEEKEMYKTTAEKYNLRMKGIKTGRGATKEDKDAEKAANEAFWNNMKKLFGILLDALL